MKEQCICTSIGDGEVLRNSQCKAHDLPNPMRPDILTRSGQYFNFLDPSDYQLDIKDIAHGLSNICRFGGHTSQFYSVAQHSIYLSHIVPAADAFAGLMHDCAEAFLGDIPSPLKQRLPDYKRIESAVEFILFAKLGIPVPLPSSVKHADLIMLATEQKRLMPPHEDEWAILKGIEPHPNIHIVPLWPEEAYVAFIERYEELTGKKS